MAVNPKTDLDELKFKEFLKSNLEELERKLVNLEKTMDIRTRMLQESDPEFRDFKARYIVLGEQALKIKDTLGIPYIPPQEINQSIPEKK